ncbi:MAG: hypothetical protein JSR09_05550 [Bacteroidetes bacterium]|nr:hypothetical protein [Bacteroidota bacterium]MBS1649153.1 hypothetical protein [Bacteroidota bacterium]
MFNKLTLALSIASLCVTTNTIAQTNDAQSYSIDTAVKIVNGRALKNRIQAQINSEINKAFDEQNFAQTLNTKIEKEFFVMGRPGKNIADSNLNKKEVSQEISVNKGTDIFIENTSRSVEIKVWDQPKVKVVTTVYFEGDGGKVSDDEWLEKLNISIKSSPNSVRIKSGIVSGGGSYSTFNVDGNVVSAYGWSSGNMAVFNGKGQNIGNKAGRRILTIYVPKENKLDIESKYADVTVTGNTNKLNVDITNGNLEVGDVKNFILRSKYGNVTTGNLGSAEIDFINGRLTTKNIDDLDIDTKYSTVEADVVNKANIRSVNDEYEIEEAGVLQGRKNYGNLRINKLTGSIELYGTNADIRLRKVDPSVSLIKVDNKYADIRIPFNAIKNYAITFNGSYSSVYSNFDKKPIVIKEEAKKEDKAKDDMGDRIRKNFKISGIDIGDNNNIETHFTATGGDGKSTKVDIKCQNCTVDFK